MQAEAEVGAWEDEKCFHEDVGDGFFFRQVGVELVAVFGEVAGELAWFVNKRGRKECGVNGDCSFKSVTKEVAS